MLKIVLMITFNIFGPLKKSITLCYLDWLGSHLAGLIEGDGSFYVPDQQSNKKKYPNARIKVVFNSKDEPLAKKLHALLGFGRFEYPKAGNYLVFYIKNYEGTKCGRR
jgi:hypothetical protein